MFAQATRRLGLLPLSLLALVSGCESDDPLDPLADRPGFEFGAPVQIGQGQARSYALYAQDGDRVPVEFGVALDSLALEGLPTQGAMLELPLALPADPVLPYRYVVLNWNPEGHPPEEVYGVPHFDFHFYMTPRSEVEAILPSDPNFARKANHVPEGDYLPPFYIVPVAPGEEVASAAEPRMGVHWVDVRSPELQGMLGNPSAYEPFTTTFIYGSWDGRITFLEPMISRAYLLTHPDVVLPISQPAAVPEAGWYPGAYRIVYDRDAKEYRIGLTDLSRRD